MKFDFDKFTDEDWDNYWLLAQHCDDNRDFQKNALSIIKKYQGTDHSHYKYLYDRISMGLTGKQKYGTQNVKEQGVAEGATNNIPTIGINVRSDGNIDYASLIVDGKKKYESRRTDSLRPYVGKTVGIVRTGNGPAVAIGQVTIGEPIEVDVEKFNKLRNQHLVPQGSKFDIESDSTKYLYPMINPVRWDNEKPIKSKGIVSRKIDEAKLSVDVPNEDWLQEKIDYAKSKGRNSYGVPYMGSTTAGVVGTPPRVRVMRLASLPGMRNEQMNVRKSDLKWLMDYMEKTGKLPPMGNSPDHEYLPYIMVAYNGEAWVNEGNHRIMAAYRLNWQDMPIEIRYFDGGERVTTGPMYPGKIGLS
jgi:predicted transcriptional regulator